MRPRSVSGQAAVEYVAVVAVVAGALLAAGLTLHGRVVAAAAIAQVERALCVVRGHDCAPLRPACSVSSSRSGDALHLDVAVVHLGGGSSAIVDRRSDGRVLVTVAHNLEVGGSAGIGAGLSIGAAGAGGELRAAAVARGGGGATYEVAGERQAAALLRLLRRPKVDPALYTPAVAAYWRRVEAVLPRVPPPIARFSEKGGAASLVATLGIGRAGAEAILGGELLAGSREDLRTGRRTAYLKATLSLDAAVRAGGRGVVGRGSARAQVAITTDREGRPLDLALLGTGALRASPDLPLLLQPLAGHLPAGAGRSWELESHLDLTQRENLVLARALLAGHGAALPRVLAASAVQARAYGTSHRQVGLDAYLRAGVGAGAGLLHTTDGARLLSAIERRGGLWVPRLDCLAPV